MDPDSAPNDEEEDWKVQLDANKSLGDSSFRSGDFSSAIQHYTAALSLDPTHAKILSNRSAAYLKNGEKSKALHDAQAIGKRMGVKGYSRLAAALQSLGRYQQALDEWERILLIDPCHAVASDGQRACKAVLEKEKMENEYTKEEGEKLETKEEKEDGEDDLDDFFNEVEDVAATAKEEQLEEEKPVATEAIRNHRKELGTVESQIDRLLSDNYKWRNLNPFCVLDMPHTSTTDDISRRYKALSLLLHPDKNLGQNHERVQEAYDQVLKAKAKLDDVDKANHTRQLVEEGMRQGKEEYKKLRSRDQPVSLEEIQEKFVLKIFATVEYNRQQVEQRLRDQEQRERKQEEEELRKDKDSRKFDTEWKEKSRVDKRVGNWRDFEKKTKRKKQV